MTSTSEIRDDRPLGIFVTVKEIHEAVGRIESTLTSEITKLKIRIAAHEVVIGMMTVVIIFLTQRGLTP